MVPCTFKITKSSDEMQEIYKARELRMKSMLSKLMSINIYEIVDTLAPNKSSVNIVAFNFHTAVGWRIVADQVLMKL
jgi:hypothetical protein